MEEKAEPRYTVIMFVASPPKSLPPQKHSHVHTQDNYRFFLSPVFLLFHRLPATLPPTITIYMTSFGRSFIYDLRLTQLCKDSLFITTEYLKFYLTSNHKYNVNLIASDCATPWWRQPEQNRGNNIEVSFVYVRKCVQSINTQCVLIDRTRNV